MDVRPHMNEASPYSPRQQRALRALLLLALWGKVAFARSLVYERLDFDPDNHIAKHARGEQALTWLRNHTEILPVLAKPADAWPDKVIIGYAGSYNFEILKPLIYSFLANVNPEAWLILLVPEGDDLGIPKGLSHRVVVQSHRLPHHLGDAEDIPYPVSLRFYIAASLLELTNHMGTVFFLDTRDVFLQRDPFEKYADGVMHFPRESGSYRIHGPYTNNHEWLLQCFGRETSEAIGGHYVLNSGTLIGPSRMIRPYFQMLLEELEHRWHCRRLHGTDQAIHNYLVYTGKLANTGIRFQIEDQVSGQFAFIAYTHPKIFDFRYHSEGREELYNIGNDQPMVAIHLWPGENRVANNVVWPMIRDFDRSLLHSVP